jgi:predicted amidophosphoribosyltransferase
LSIAVAPRLLRRRRRTVPQAELTPPQRWENVRGAFRASRSSWLGCRFAGARVLLVDDILTTGATASESARVLRRAGAAFVAVAVVARAEPPG